MALNIYKSVLNQLSFKKAFDIFKTSRLSIENR